MSDHVLQKNKEVKINNRRKFYPSFVDKILTRNFTSQLLKSCKNTLSILFFDDLHWKASDWSVSFVEVSMQSHLLKRKQMSVTCHDLVNLIDKAFGNDKLNTTYKFH